MIKTYTPSTMTYSISDTVSDEVKVPELATAAQVSVFDKKLAEIELTFSEQVELAYLSAFDVELVRSPAPNLEEVA